MMKRAPKPLSTAQGEAFGRIMRRNAGLTIQMRQTEAGARGEAFDFATLTGGDQELAALLAQRFAEGYYI